MILSVILEADNLPTDFISSVTSSVIVAFSSNCFRTLYEIPTDYYPSVVASINVAFSSNYFRTLYEMPTDYYPSVWASVIVAFQVIIFLFTFLQTLK